MGKFFVYKHTNNITKKSYIGFTSKTVEQRWQAHIWDARSGKGVNSKFPKAIRKYGEFCWDTETLAVFDNQSDALKHEKIMVERHDTMNNGYNTIEGGRYSPTGLKMDSSFGVAVSNRQRGKDNPCYDRKYSKKERLIQSEKMKVWHKNNIHPRKGSKASVYTRKKMSDAHKGEKNSFFGKTHSKETKKLMSERNPVLGLWGWMNPCTRKNTEAMDIYARAKEYYSWWVDVNKGADVMCRVFKEKRRKPHLNMIEKFKLGWNPNECEKWLGEYGE